MEFGEKSSHKGLQGVFFTSLTVFSSPNREKRAASWILQRAPLRWGSLDTRPRGLSHATPLGGCCVTGHDPSLAHAGGSCHP